MSQYESKTLEELREIATSKNVEFYKTISKTELIKKLEDVEATAPAEPKVDSMLKAFAPTATKQTVKESAAKSAAAIIAEQEKANRQTKVVKVTMVDKREASTATSAYFSSMKSGGSFPLDTWVELPMIIINQIKKATMEVQVTKGDQVTFVNKPKYVIEYRHV